MRPLHTGQRPLRSLMRGPHALQASMWQHGLNAISRGLDMQMMQRRIVSSKRSAHRCFFLLGDSRGGGGVGAASLRITDLSDRFGGMGHGVPSIFAAYLEKRSIPGPGCSSEAAQRQ